MSEELAKELFIPNGTEEEYAILAYIEQSPPVAEAVGYVYGRLV